MNKKEKFINKAIIKFGNKFNYDEINYIDSTKKIKIKCNKHNLFLVEDAAQAIDSYYYSKEKKKNIALGSIGHLAAFSFHETKNIISGEGGMLVINDESLISRAEIIWEKVKRPSK